MSVAADRSAATVNGQVKSLTQQIGDLRDEEAERHLISDLLLLQDRIDDAVAIARPDDLSSKTRTLILDALVELRADSHDALDPSAVRHYLTDAGLWNGALDAELDGITRPGAYGTGAWKRHAETIADLARRRRAAHAGYEVAQAAVDGNQQRLAHHAELLAGTVIDGAGSALVERMRSRLVVAEGLKTLPRPEWVIDGLVQRNSLVVLYSKPGAGKTFVELDWCCSTATGSWWFGRAVTKGPVLYIAAEGVEGLSLRVDAWKSARRTYHLPDDLVFYPEPVNFLHADEVAALTSIAAQLQPVLIVVDTLGRSMAGGDENSSKDMGLIVDRLDGLRRATRAAVSVAHHGTKADGTLRGHTSLEGAAHTVIELKGAEGRLMLTTTKQKDAAPAAPIRLHLVPELESAVLADRPGLDDDSEGVTVQARQVLELLVDGALDDGMSTSTWLAMAIDQGIAKSSFWKHRKALVSTGLVHDIGTKAKPRYLPATSQDAPEHEDF